MSMLPRNPSDSAFLETVCFGTESMIACSVGSGSKRTLPFARPFTASHICCAETEMPGSRMVFRMSGISVFDA